MATFIIISYLANIALFILVMLLDAKQTEQVFHLQSEIKQLQTKKTITSKSKTTKSKSQTYTRKIGDIKSK